MHTDDLASIIELTMPTAALYTIRRGELVYDNIGGGLKKTREEIVKIQSAPGTTACCFYDEDQTACRIYDSRPVECRAMACWDEKQIKSVYAAGRLDRAAIFSSVQWLMDLINAHEMRCAYEQLDAWVQQRAEGDEQATEEILATIRYDAAIRAQFKEKSEKDAAMLDLFFGRPLSYTIERQYGIKPARACA